MIITIDTNRDSPEDLRKAIKALIAILGDGSGSGYSGGSKNIFDSPGSGSGSDAAPAGNIFGNIFGDDSGSGSGAGTSEYGGSPAPSSSDEDAEVEIY